MVIYHGIPWYKVKNNMATLRSPAKGLTFSELHEQNPTINSKGQFGNKAIT